MKRDNSPTEKRKKRAQPVGVCSICSALTNLREDIYYGCDRFVNGTRCAGTFNSATMYVWYECGSCKATGKVESDICGKCFGYGWTVHG